MRTFLFLLASARPDGNTEALARHAADGLPAGTPQRWLNLTEFPLPAFEDIRHTPGVRYAEPSGNERVLLDATMAASDLVVASATGPVRCATTPMRWPKAPAFFASSVAEGAPQTA